MLFYLYKYTHKYVHKYIYKHSEKTNDDDLLIRYVYRINPDMDTSQPSVNISPAMLSPGIFFKTNDYNNCNLLVFQSMNNIEPDIKKIQYHKNIKYVYAFRGVDDIANKRVFTRTLGTNGLTQYIPKTWAISDVEQIKKFLNKSKHNSIILKNNAQQQRGIHITNTWNDTYQNDYLIAQELLQNPLLVAGHKINIRIYLMIFIHNKQLNAFYYNDGFIYYAPEKWQTNTTDSKINITTGLGDRKLYETNPLTYQDLKNVLKEDEFETLNQNLNVMMKKIIQIYKNQLIKLNSASTNKHIVYAHILGCDIAPEADLTVKIMEINKGPDLRYKDNRDREVKQNLSKDFQNYLVYKNVSNKMIKV